MRMFGYETYGGPEVQQFLDVPEPVPGPGQVLVWLVAAAVNPADVKVRSGLREYWRFWGPPVVCSGAGLPTA